MPSQRSQPLPDGPPHLEPAPFAPREIRLPARPSELRRAREYADDAAEEFGLDAKRRYEFVFAANEAVTNAIRHGQPDDDGKIRMRIAAIEDALTVEVCDRGPFVARVADAEPLRDRGRGFQFMLGLVDAIQLSIGPERTVVRLHKRRSAPAGSGSP
jgi:anti-sigma regulatory factor (Ser/Thr protein kinase)